MVTAAPPAVDRLEAAVLDLVATVPASAPPRRRGRPEILPVSLVWMGLLVCLLHGETTQRAVWRRLTAIGLWRASPVAVSVDAVYKKLARTGAATMEQLFHCLTADLLARPLTALPPLPFPQVFALDESPLDPVVRRLPWARALPRGHAALLPGKLIVTYDVVRHAFHDVHLTDQPHQNERVHAWEMVTRVPAGSLVLADLGYFGFEWFDRLTDAGYCYVSRLRAETSYTVAHVLIRHDLVTESLVWLGAYRADRAKHLVRLIEVRHGGQVHRYLTNVTEPRRLSTRQVLDLYRQRWDVELAFKLAKTDLGLQLLWSTHWNVILAQVWGVLIIAQIALFTQRELAARAQVTVDEVSLSLLVKYLPELLAQGIADPLGHLAARRDYGGFIRPSRRIASAVPEDLVVIPPPPELVTERAPRYAGRRCGPNRTDRRPE